MRSYHVYIRVTENLNYAKMMVMWFLPSRSFRTKPGRTKMYSEKKVNAFHVFDTPNIDTTYISVLYVIPSFNAFCVS